MSVAFPDLSGSEDEFPDVLDLVRRQKATNDKLLAGEENKENPGTVAPTPGPKRSPVKLLQKHRDAGAETPLAAVGATPMRRRKLGLSQAVFTNSLLKPWNETEAGQEEELTRTVSKNLNTKTPGRARARNTARDVGDVSIFSVSKQPMTGRKQRPALLIDSSDDEEQAPKTVARPTTSRKPRPQLLIDSSPEGDDSSRDFDVSKLSTRLNLAGSPSKKPRGGARSNKSNTSSLFFSDRSGHDSIAEEKSFDLSSQNDDSHHSNTTSVSNNSNSTNGDDASEFTAGDSSNASSVYNSGSDIFASPAARKKKPGKKRVLSGPPKSIQSMSKKPANSTTEFSLEDQFQKLNIFNEGDRPKEDAHKRPSTPPLKKGKMPLLTSPSKSPNRIPQSPWKPENKEFWDPQVNFGWIDQHSPQRKLADVADKKTIASPQKSKRDEREAKKAFDDAKDDIARVFLTELDQRVTDGQLSKLTEATGGLKITWSNTLQSTAGRAHWKCKTVVTVKQQKVPVGEESSAPATKREETRQHEASIELATKVLNNEADLLNTVAHEFCHLATFMLEPGKVPAHGAAFKAWGRKCSSIFGKTKGIEVTTKHKYEIDYKYVWRCAGSSTGAAGGGCGAEVSRHSRSVDPTRQRCGACKGHLVQIKPKPRGAAALAAATMLGESASAVDSKKKQVTTKPKSAWQEFHSKTMKELSVTHKGLTLQQKMEIVSARWKDEQARHKEQQQQDESMDKTQSDMSSIIVAAEPEAAEATTCQQSEEKQVPQQAQEETAAAQESMSEQELASTQKDDEDADRDLQTQLQQQFEADMMMQSVVEGVDELEIHVPPANEDVLHTPAPPAAQSSTTEIEQMELVQEPSEVIVSVQEAEADEQQQQVDLVKITEEPEAGEIIVAAAPSARDGQQVAGDETRDGERDFQIAQ